MRFAGCTLAIIAGGRATRLGGIVKAHLRLPSGETILERTLALLAAEVEEVVVAESAEPNPARAARFAAPSLGRKGLKERFDEPLPAVPLARQRTQQGRGGEARSASGVRFCADSIPNRGAPGGVHAVCLAAQTEWVLALASDLPSVSPDALEILWSHRGDSDCVISGRSPDRPEPLHAFYRARLCAEAFGAALRDESPSFASILRGIRTTFVPADELRRVDPQLATFENVNTPDDVSRLGLQLPPIAN